MVRCDRNAYLRMSCLIEQQYVSGARLQSDFNPRLSVLAEDAERRRTVRANSETCAQCPRAIEHRYLRDPFRGHVELAAGPARAVEQQKFLRGHHLGRRCGACADRSKQMSRN